MITLTFSNLKSLVKKHLSIIGKRMYDKDGKNMFSNITVSSAEDPIFEQYIVEAAQNVEAILRQFVTSFSSSSTQVSLTLVSPRGITNFETRCGEIIQSYIVTYSVAEYLSMTHPDFAAKYMRQRDANMESLVAYAFSKEAPVTANTFVNPTGQVTT